MEMYILALLSCICCTTFGGDENLMKYVSDAADETKKMQFKFEKDLQSEGFKGEKMKIENDKTEGALKREIEQWSQKVQEMEKKVQLAEERVKPAADEAMKQARSEQEKLVAGEQAKLVQEQEKLNKEVAQEAAKADKLKADMGKKSALDEKNSKKAADQTIAEASKTTNDVTASTKKVQDEANKKMLDFQAELAQETKVQEEGFKQERDALQKEIKEAKDTAKANADKKFDIHKKKIADTLARIPAEKDVAQKTYAPMLEVAKKEKIDEASKLKEQTDKEATMKVQVEGLKQKVKAAQDKGKSDLAALISGMDAKIKAEEDKIKKLKDEKEALNKKIASMIGK